MQDFIHSKFFVMMVACIQERHVIKKTARLDFQIHHDCVPSVASEFSIFAAAVQLIMSAAPTKRKLSLPGACKTEPGGHGPPKQMKGNKSRGQRTLDEFEKHAAKLREHVEHFDTWMSLAIVVEYILFSSQLRGWNIISES